MKIFIQQQNKKVIFIEVLLIILLLLILGTYAANVMNPEKSIITKTLRIDEEAYGNNVFDSSNLEFRPILDTNVETETNHIVNINFNVGGSAANDEENIVYDIALVDLEISCELLSKYLKWKLIKNNVEISTGSFDYQFETIKNGRYVLTTIQQDLKDYSEDKTGYDHYEFYLWLSDSCQEEEIEDCVEDEDQSLLMDKKISGKIEVELYADTKKVLVRNPSDELDKSTCVMEDGDLNGEL